MTSYGPTTTTDEVLEGIDLTGKRIVITGAATGLGRETARAFAAHGASVTVLARSEDRAAEGVAAVLAEVPGADVQGGAVDLGDLSSVRAGAAALAETTDVVDVLVNNAGVMACPFGHTVDGFETQFGTNHLGHFLLTRELAPLLLASDAPRVVTLSSAGHSRADVDLDDPNFEHTPYGEWVAYGRAKTANALFARELATRGGAHGILSFSVHPGGIITDLGRHLDDALIQEMLDFSRQRAATTRDADAEADGKADPTADTGFVWKSVPAGAATQVWASVAPELVDHNGAYLADCGLGVLGANPGANGFLPHLLDDDHAARLWDLSEELVGARFAF